MKSLNTRINEKRSRGRQFLPPLTDTQVEAIIYFYTKENDNSIPLIAKKVGLSVQRVNTIVERYLCNPEPPINMYFASKIN